MDISEEQMNMAPSGFVPATPQGSGSVSGSTPGGAGLMGQYSRNNPNYQNRDRSASTGKKAGITALVVIVLAALVAGGFFIYKEMQKSSINDNLHKMSAEQLMAIDAELTGATSFDEPFTVLLLGSDARADDPDMGARTDTIIVVRVDANENIVSMVSIPRDTMIEIDGVGMQKFNAAYTYGGESGTIAAVKKLTGVDIDHFAEVNFEGLVGLIDAIGGIDVVIDEEIDDEDAGGHIDAGKQHLNGKEALILSRSRAYVDGDYTRQVNQRKVIMGIIDKALTAPATELAGLIQASTEFLTTDSGMDFDFIYSLADQIRHNNEKEIKIYSATIPSSTATINQISYVIADTAGVKAMMKRFLKGKDVSKGVKDSSINEDIAAIKSRYPDDPNATTPENGGGETYYDPSLYEEGYTDGGQQDYGEVYYEDQGGGEEGYYDASSYDASSYDASSYEE